MDDDLRRDLDAYLDVEVPTGPLPELQEDGTEPEAPVAPAPDEEFANRLLYKARRLYEEGRDIELLAEAEVERIRGWESDRLSGINREQARIEESLGQFMRTWHRAHPRSKTLKLSNGKLSLTAPRGSVTVTDTEALIEWAKAYRPDLLRWTPAPELKPLGDELLTGRAGEPVQQEVRGRLANIASLMAAVPAEGTGEQCAECGDAQVRYKAPERRPADDEHPEPWATAPEWVCDACGAMTTAEADTAFVPIPGVAYAVPVQDSFKITLATDEANHEEDA